VPNDARRHLANQRRQLARILRSYEQQIAENGLFKADRSEVRDRLGELIEVLAEIRGKAKSRPQR
jgi:hypothetical protein